MKLYNVFGELVKTTQTDSGILPRDVAVTKNGDLIYTDPGNSTVNIITNTQRNITFGNGPLLYLLFIIGRCSGCNGYF